MKPRALENCPLFLYITKKKHLRKINFPKRFDSLTKLCYACARFPPRSLYTIKPMTNPTTAGTIQPMPIVKKGM